MAESGWRPLPTPRAYRGERRTGQSPCYAVECTLSPVSVHSPVRYLPAPRIGRARVGVQPGRMVPAQRIWLLVRHYGPGYPAPALRTVSPVLLKCVLCLHTARWRRATVRGPQRGCPVRGPQRGCPVRGRQQGTPHQRCHQNGVSQSWSGVYVPHQSRHRG